MAMATPLFGKKRWQCNVAEFVRTPPTQRNDKLLNSHEFSYKLRLNVLEGMAHG